MPLEILVSARAPVAPGEWIPANRMPELARTILGIGAGRGGGATNRMSGAGLWIRIHFLRIRIQSLMLETNMDPGLK